MTTIPRAEIDAIMERYDDCWGDSADPSADAVSEYATGLRTHALTYPADIVGLNAYREDLAEAADLDALADRYEREAS